MFNTRAIWLDAKLNLPILQYEATKDQKLSTLLKVTVLAADHEESLRYPVLGLVPYLLFALWFSDWLACLSVSVELYVLPQV